MAECSCWLDGFAGANIDPDCAVHHPESSDREDSPTLTCQRCGFTYDKGACPECWYADSKWGL